MIIECNVSNPEVTTGYINKSEILKGVFLSHCLVTVKDNNYVTASVLNTNDKNVVIEPLCLELHPCDLLEDLPYQINSINYYSNSKKIPSNRSHEVKKQIRTAHLNAEESKALLYLCSEYSGLFYLEEDTLTCTKTIEQEIKTTNPQPIHVKTYRYPECHKEEVNNQIQKMLKQNIIKPSNSSWSSPIWVVPKKQDASKQKKWQIVVDYRKLNDVTIGDAYPIPNMSDILDQLGHSKYFSTLDLLQDFTRSQ
ncbi:jg19491 [Pararge aegeria aegeria]|uniref:Jg19491 protein n=1 Tax=Pararge aegeria aegeria TaxID=348720 RepID=A0A8S4QFV7_9NEOP|nr:jg19491 [Pararge aegeria aegeria]